jgi:hypothetical protein
MLNDNEFAKRQAALIRCESAVRDVLACTNYSNRPNVSDRGSYRTAIRALRAAFADRKFDSAGAYGG